MEHQRVFETGGRVPQEHIPLSQEKDTTMRHIELSPPSLDTAEKDALLRVIDDNWLAMGKRVRTLEEAFASLHGIGHGVALNSCTAALHLSLAAHGIGPGDEVLLPSLSFVATANAAIYVGARPVFVDVEDELVPHMSLALARQAITPRTRAIITMHYAGYLMDMRPWRELADEHNLVLIEDAAHAAGLEGAGRHSHASAFSFYSNKNMTTGEGGMLLVHDAELEARLRLMRSHGMTSTTITRDQGHAFGYDVVEAGFNYRLDELRAAIGLEQLARLAERNARRVELTGLYRRHLASVAGLGVPFSPAWTQCGHIMPVLLPEGADRLQTMMRLREQGVQSSVHYRPIHTFTQFAGTAADQPVLPMTEAFGRRTLTLPLHPGLSDDDVAYVVEALTNALG